MKFIRTPFANNGDKDPVPQTDPSGNVNWDLGYPISYSKDPAVDPTAKRIEREMFNEIFNFLSAGLRELQVTGVAPFIPAADNGGVAYPYGLGAIVNYQEVSYISLKVNNTSLPTVAADWSPISSQAFVQDMIGNFSDSALLTASTTLTAAQAGMVFGVGTSGINITMPDLTLVPNGASYTIKNLSNGRATLTPPAGGSFYISDQTLATYILRSGESVTMVGAATVYGVIQHSSNGNHIDGRYAEGVTLLPSDAGGFYAAGGTSITTNTLPDLFKCKPGDIFMFRYTGNNTLRILPFGTQKIIIGSIQQNSVDVGPQEWLGIININGSWVSFGSAVDKYQSNWGSSKAITGYQKLPSGLIIQWGSTTVATVVGNNVNKDVTFPIAFPGGGLIGFAVPKNATPSQFITTSAEGISATLLTIVCSSGISFPALNVGWIAIGA